jgi:hypothetical protein
VRGKWYAVVRYDTAHGFAHKDVFHPDGSSEKEELGMLDYNDALTFAQEDIANNWEYHKRRYVDELRKEKEK